MLTGIAEIDDALLLATSASSSSHAAAEVVETPSERPYPAILARGGRALLPLT
jgi:hypothetical protein